MDNFNFIELFVIFYSIQPWKFLHPEINTFKSKYLCYFRSIYNTFHTFAFIYSAVWV